MAEQTFFQLNLNDFVSPSLKKILANGQSTFTALHKLNQRFHAGVKGTNKSLLTLNKQLSGIRGTAKHFAFLNQSVESFNRELSESIVKANTLAASLQRVSASQLRATGAASGGGAAAAGFAAAPKRAGGGRARGGRGVGRMEGLASGVLGTKTRARIGEAKGRMRGLAGATGAAGGGMMAAATNPATIAAVAGIIGAVGTGKAIFDASQFESEMSTVQALTQATSRDLRVMHDQILQSSEASVFGAKSAAEATQFLAKAGLTAKQSMDALAPTLEIATAGNLDLAKAADISTDIMTMFGKEASELSGINDMLASTASSANVSIQEIFETLKKVGPVAASTNQPMSETLALIGKLGQAGIRGSEAGTQLRGMLISLISPAKQGQKALEALGVSTRDSEGNLRNLMDIMKEVKEEGVTGGEDVIFDIFRRRAGTAFSVLIQKNQKELQSFADQIRTDYGRAAEMAETRTANVIGELQRLGGVLSVISTKFGEPFLEPLTNMIKGIRKAFQGTSEFFNRLGNIIRDSFSRFNIFGGALQPIIDGFKSITGTQVLDFFLTLGDTFSLVFRIVGNLFSALKPLTTLIGTNMAEAFNGANATLAGLNVGLEFVAGFVKVAAAAFRGLLDITLKLVGADGALTSFSNQAKDFKNFVPGVRSFADQVRVQFAGIAAAIDFVSEKISNFFESWKIIPDMIRAVNAMMNRPFAPSTADNLEKVWDRALSQGFFGGSDKGQTMSEAINKAMQSTALNLTQQSLTDTINKLGTPGGKLEDNKDKGFGLDGGNVPGVNQALAGDRGARDVNNRSGARGLIVNIDNLINELNIKTEKLDESKAKIRRFVLEALTEGVGDFEKSFSR